MTASEAQLANLNGIEEQIPAFTAYLYQTIAPYTGKRVLDAGAGTGTYSELLAKDGKQVIALEGMPSYVETMQARFKGDAKVEVVDGNLSSAESLPDFAPAASAICINVIEHIEDDKQALRNIRERLTADGKLIVLVPAHPWLFNSLDEAVGHYRRYTRDTLQAALTGSGWKIEKLTYFNSFSIPAWILSGNKETPGSVMTKVGSALMPVLSWFDRNIARGAVGISLIAIATKA